MVARTAEEAKDLAEASFPGNKDVSILAYNCKPLLLSLVLIHDMSYMLYDITLLSKYYVLLSFVMIINNRL